MKRRVHCDNNCMNRHLITVVLRDRLRLPARNATTGQLAAIMRRAWLDRPVVHRTGLNGRYDIVLECMPDGTQLGGSFRIPRAGSRCERMTRCAPLQSGAVHD